MQEDLFVEFAGIFFEEGSLALEVLKRLEGDRYLGPIRTTTHCTFSYHPSDEQVEFLNQIVGDTIDIELIGYGNDGKNSGFLINIVSEGYSDYYLHRNRKGNPICKHITMSIDKENGASAVNTKYLALAGAVNPLIPKYFPFLVDHLSTPSVVVYETALPSL